ncbi:MAG: DNA-deoxyinosine glycosylase [Methyloprofundus sp.]|nr:DNA-deoxyinosine glycosylase [Methyloprofundus sp.]
MTQISGFNILGNQKAQLLILGSMPSVTSLEKQQYYAHPRNAFWPIMAALFNEDKLLDYQQGQLLLQAQGIAVWDVLKSCVRQGSLDSAIDKNSMEINDFISLFKTFRQIRCVFFNGGTAESLYKKNVYQRLPVEYRTLNYAKLPSTSPAYAAMCYKDKLAAWTALKNCRVGSAFLPTRL